MDKEWFLRWCAEDYGVEARWVGAFRLFPTGEMHPESGTVYHEEFTEEQQDLAREAIIQALGEGTEVDFLQRPATLNITGTPEEAHVLVVDVRTPYDAILMYSQEPNERIRKIVQSILREVGMPKGRGL